MTATPTNPHTTTSPGLPTSGGFTKTPGWLDWYVGPSVPTFALPVGAVDAHCHVFGPGAQFPYAAERKYTPCDASADQLFALRDRLRFTRNVIVQATCHGADNSAMVAALGAAQGAARGVATVRADVSDAELARLHDAGVRGVRFNFVRRLVDVTPRADLEAVVAKIAPLGWHVVIYFEGADLADLRDFFVGLPVPLVVDHMGRPDVTKDVDGPEFGAFLSFLDARDDIWCKVSCPERLSVTGPPALPSSLEAAGMPGGERAGGHPTSREHAAYPPFYADVVPLGAKVVREFGDRVLWGTDWPHPNLKDHMPDDGLLVDYIPRIAPTAAAQRALLVDNPTRLYWPELPRELPQGDTP